MKKILLWLSAFILLSNSGILAQTETEVMNRYDYSSPEASFESYKQAIKNKDAAGIAIHLWQAYKANPDVNLPAADFTDFAAQSEAAVNNLGFEKAFAPFTKINWGAKRYNITDLDFIQEKDRIYDKDAKITSCFIILADKNSGELVTADLWNLDGTKEWWLSINID